MTTWVARLALVFACGVLIYGLITNYREHHKRMFCPTCEYAGPSKRRRRGSLGIELVLWLLFIVPGLLYTLWRSSDSRPTCPSCGEAGMIPADSPAARKANNTPSSDGH